jgi:HlyD family secretion protein
MLRKKTLYKYLGGLVFLIILILLIAEIFFTSSFQPENVEISRVDYGPVKKVIKAQGIVKPRNEVTISSPAKTKVLKINYEPGSHVKAGDTILILDQEPIKEDVERLRDELNMLKNSLEKTMLQARSTKLDLDYNIETKKLKIASIKSQLADEKQLLEVGGISPAKLEKTKQALTSAKKDLKMTQEKNLIRLKQLKAEEEGLKIKIDIQERKLVSKHLLLHEMFVAASSDGIILDIYKKPDEKVNSDELLIKMSNLSSFKIIGSLDERKADIVAMGQQVIAVIEEDKIIEGRVGNIKPVIENNKIGFEVFLEKSDCDKLISNMKIDLLLVTEMKENVVRIKKGPAFSGDKFQEVYLKKGNKAYLTEIETGMKGYKHMEIVSGVDPGDELLISNISSITKKEVIDLE